MTIEWADPVSAAGDVSIPALLLAEHYRDVVRMGALTSRRSLQRSIGASEIGSACARQQAYKAMEVAPTNVEADPLRALIGTGVHMALADIFTRADGGAGRYLIEHSLSYRGIPGSVDLYDRISRVVWDHKSSVLVRIRDYRRSGPPGHYVVQSMIYAMALRESGEQPERVALAFVPLDGKLSDIFVWTWDVQPVIADEAIDRYLRARETARQHGVAAVEPTPGPLCKWCSHYAPGTTDLSRGCPGPKEQQ